VPMAANSNDSAITVRHTWRRVAPMARNMPISRVRSITPMASVLSSAISEGSASALRMTK